MSHQPVTLEFPGGSIRIEWKYQRQEHRITPELVATITADKQIGLKTLNVQQLDINDNEDLMFNPELYGKFITEIRLAAEEQAL